MTCEELTERIKKYRPFNEQEEADKVLILDWIGNNKNAFSRENTVAHMTASAWVVNKDRSMVFPVLQKQICLMPPSLPIRRRLLSNVP